ncbi:MAG: glycosyltransferase [Gemmataceae bacterium]|nr:glycosyltransferase [Gemmataceae bacterium]
MPRVAFVLHLMQVAGAEVLVAEAIRRLAGRIDACVLCLDGVGPLGEQLRAEGTPVVCLDRRSGRDWGLPFRMARELRSRRIDVVHAHQYAPFLYSALARVLCWMRPRLIFTEHGRHYPDVVSAPRRVANRLVLRHLADDVNACCAFSARAVERVEGFAPTRVSVLENGIEVGRYGPAADRDGLRRRLGLDPSRRYVGCVARFHPVKDHAMLVRAFAAAAPRHPEAELLLAGDGPLRGELEAQAAALGIAGRVRFLGVRRDVPDLLAACDVFALTSVSEAASLTVLEAMATGLPVVATAVGGNPEMVRDGAEGLLVPRGDDRACAAALSRLLGEPGLARRLGEAGRRRVEERYRLESTIEGYHRLYRKLAGRSAGGGP